MTSNTVLWTYALAPDVTVRRAERWALLRTATGQIRIDAAAELGLLDLLAGSENSETPMHGQAQRSELHGDADARCVALLARLERLGLLARGVSSSGRLLASCVPLRPPPHALPQRPPEGALRLSPRAIARAEAKLMVLEAPGSWAKMMIHDRELLPLLHDLAIGTTAEEITTVLPRNVGAAIFALMDWCELLDRGDRPAWPIHDLLFHARTRAGFARGLRGKVAAKADHGTPLVGQETTDSRPRIALEQPVPDRLLAKDPPYALVSERRQSIRRQGSKPATAAELSEFLFRTLHERNGRRPYPSGGDCYPLNAYVAVHRCLGLARGLYAYDPLRHELIMVSEPGPTLDRLLADAAGAASTELAPQILIVFAAKYVRMQRDYPDIGYSLILKEVGAVFQAAMLAAAAMRLAACPLGCGNSLLFAELAGVDPLVESSVGELMLGSLAENA
jgi:SagB-type dehydrogenase family enzyme